MRKVVFIVIILSLSNVLFSYSIENFQKLFSNPKKIKAAKFIIDGLPLYDRLNISKELLIENLEYAFLAKYLMPWGKEIPEEIFKEYVLPHRVTQEPLERWRKKFFEELGEKVHNLSMKQAVLYISKWCFQQSKYKPTYPWDSGPLDVIKLGYGRCEEKAILLIDALRSVSIPARLAFVPAWQHSNGNHAWVEVWINGKWHVLEIAKPVKILDKPWFLGNYSVMPAVYTYVYGKGIKNITERYNKNICELKINNINDKVFLSIFNSGMMRIVGIVKNGKIKIGYGSYLLTTKDGYQIIDCFKKEKRINLKLKKLRFDNISFILKSQKPNKINKNNAYDLNEIKKIDNFREKKFIKIKQKILSYFKDLTFNHKKEFINKIVFVNDFYKDYYEILKNMKEPERKIFVKFILQFEKKDIVRINPYNLLSDFELALKYRKNFYSEKIFLEYVANPRIYFELISLWRDFILNKFQYLNSLPLDKIVKEALQIVHNLKKINKKDRGPMLTPVDVLKLEKYNSDNEAMITIVSILRSFGIPARFDISGNFIEIYLNKKWQYLKTKFNNFNKIANVKIFWEKLYRKCPDKLNYDRDFTIAIFKNGYFKSLRFLAGKWNKDECSWLGFNIPVKRYFIIRGKRASAGTIVDIFYNKLEFLK